MSPKIIFCFLIHNGTDKEDYSVTLATLVLEGYIIKACVLNVCCLQYEKALHERYFML